MNRFLFITLATFGLMQLALGGVAFNRDDNSLDNNDDVESDGNDDGNEGGGYYYGGVLPSNLVEPMYLEKPECTNPRNLVVNLDYLSGTISGVELYDIFNPETIYKLQASLIMKRKELIEPMQSLLEIANAYEDTVNNAEDKAVERLANMTDEIHFDMKTADLVKNKIDLITDDLVKEGCNNVATAYEYIKIFNSTVEEYKQNYADAVSPHLSEIIKGIEDLSVKYNEADPDFEAANEEIKKLSTLIQTETDAMKTYADQNLEQFENKLKEEGEKCRKFLVDLYNEFVQLLQNLEKN